MPFYPKVSPGGVGAEIGVISGGAGSWGKGGGGGEKYFLCVALGVRNDDMRNSRMQRPQQGSVATSCRQTWRRRGSPSLRELLT